jgi:hypothetical protein
MYNSYVYNMLYGIIFIMLILVCCLPGHLPPLNAQLLMTPACSLPVNAVGHMERT